MLPEAEKETMRHWKQRSFRENDGGCSAGGPSGAPRMRGPSRSRLEKRRKRARFFLLLTARNVALATVVASAAGMVGMMWLMERSLHGLDDGGASATSLSHGDVVTSVVDARSEGIDATTGNDGGHESISARENAEGEEAAGGARRHGLVRGPEHHAGGGHGLVRHTGRQRTSSNDPFPPLDTLLDQTDLRHQHLRPDANASFLVDFAVIGFAKTGTTALMRYLSSFSDVLAGERCDMVVNDTALLVHSLYTELPRPRSLPRHLDPIGKRGGAGRRTRPRGLKCPQDVSSEDSLQNYARYFPSTKLIIGIRHPLFFFESLYNFRLRTMHWRATDLLPPNNLTRRCIAGSLGVCGWRAEFADFLARLGKTSRSTDKERELLRLNLPVLDPPGVGEVFLYEMSQLSDDDPAAAASFRRDLLTFLGLDNHVAERMGPIPHVGLEQILPPPKEGEAEEEVPTEALERRINICDEEHWIIQTVLLDKARRTSVWLREYFLKTEDVTVSSREHLVKVLESWMDDPCQGRKR